MKVSLWVGTTEYVLAHGAERGVDLHAGPGENFQNDVASLLQEDPVIGAAAVVISDKGNRSTRLSFYVEVEKASVDDAILYASFYPYSVPRAGIIRISHGSQAVDLTGGIDRISARLEGVTVVLSYTLRAGAVVGTSRVIGLAVGSFADTAVGSSSTATLTITNTGNALLTVSGISCPANFSGSWSGTIAPGASQNVIITFTPPSVGSFSGTITVASDATGGTSTKAVAGNGI